MSNNPWSSWFAWYPVKMRECDGGGWRWLVTVEKATMLFKGWRLNYYRPVRTEAQKQEASMRDKFWDELLRNGIGGDSTSL